VSLAESRRPVLSQLYACGLFRDGFDDLRRGRKSSITKLIDILNKSLFLYIFELSTCVRGCVLILGCFASKAFRQRRTFEIPFSSSDSEIYAILRFYISHRCLNSSSVVRFMRFEVPAVVRQNVGIMWDRESRRGSILPLPSLLACSVDGRISAQLPSLLSFARGILDRCYA
jgi:hypothetical protein